MKTVGAEVRKRWENLIKVSHWENSVSVDAELKKKEDMTGTLFITLFTALTIALSMGMNSQLVHNVLQTQSFEAIHFNDVQF